MTGSETVTDKILQYRDDYNNRPSNHISFVATVTSTSGRLHCAFVLLSFFQTHRETTVCFLHLSLGVPVPHLTQCMRDV
jgi:hypothetical protein